MKKSIKSYDRDFKEKAVILSYERGCIEQVEKELGITHTLLNRWRRDYEKFGSGSFCGSGYIRLNPRQQKIENLEKRIRQADLQSEILKKAIPFLLLGKPATLQFIENHKDIYTLKLLCKVLKTSPNTFRRWKHEFISETQKEKTAIKKEIAMIYYASQKRYGCARITVELQKLGYPAKSSTVGRYMRQLGIYVSIKK